MMIHAARFTCTHLPLPSVTVPVLANLLMVDGSFVIAIGVSKSLPHPSLLAERLHFSVGRAVCASFRPAHYD
jgi:hypothetical protein